MPSYGAPTGREQSWIAAGISPRTQWPGSYHGLCGFGYEERTPNLNITRHGSQSDSSSSDASTVASGQYCVMQPALPRAPNSGTWSTALNSHSGGQSQYGSGESSIPQRGSNGYASNWYDYGQRSSLQTVPSLNESMNNHNHLTSNAYQPYDAAPQQQPQLARAPYATMISSYESQSTGSQGEYPAAPTKMTMPGVGEYHGTAADTLDETE